jgi:hypothetical protein
LINAAIAATVFAVIAGSYRLSNIPPKRPQGVSANAVFWWAGHLGLPAPRHGRWLECWAEIDSAGSRCRVTEMNGKIEYDGLYLPNTDQPAIAQSNFKILIETTRDANLWIGMNDGNYAPLIFLQNGTILIPKDGYSEGLSKLDRWEQDQPK